MFRRGFKTWCENAAIRFRRELGLDGADPLDPMALAAHLGVQVWVPEQVPGLRSEALHQLTVGDAGNWSAVTLRLPAGDLVIVNSSHAVTRRASSIMHELAHIIRDHRPARTDVSHEGHLLLQSFDRDQEDEANWFAGTLLVPRTALMVALTRFAAMEDIARFFGVSMDLLNWRRQVTGADVQMRRRRSRIG